MTDQTPDSAPAKTGPGYLLTILIALTVSAVTAMTTVAIYDRQFAQKIVALDLKGYIRQQRDRMVAGELDEAQLRKNLDTMEAALLAVPANHTVLMKEVVLRNAREIRP
ncbi:MAG: hypothetical protein A2521_10765 [Deltaproteobacteria bacterium RIFOXYD12_FULL_57_12]|nr:MAG: hypothetical protein A2521_10765 [Deltaproteobacteria bacterium RIFOXYD12_FULL_57_12]